MFSEAEPPPSQQASAAGGARRSPVCEIQLQNPGRDRSVQARRLRPWLERLVAELAPGAGSLVVRFVSDREMQRFNSTYRGKDRPTDVLSFAGDLDGSAAPGSGFEDPEKAAVHLGDIVISLPTARRQAVGAGHPIQRELRLLLLHGVLHCLGHDHETDGGEMERLEKGLRQRWIDHE